METHAPCEPEAGRGGVSDSEAAPIPTASGSGEDDRIASVFSVPQS